MPASSGTALFLSLRPAYAELLLSGEKTVELRRIRPRAAPGTLVIVYAASPIRAAMGTCVVRDIGDSSPDDIWRMHGASTGVGRSEFRAYFRGCDRAVAITVRSPRRFDGPISLEKLRSRWLGFQPPQSFRYVPIDDVTEMIAPNGIVTPGNPDAQQIASLA